MKVGPEDGGSRDPESALLCPSAQPEMENAAVFGVVSETAGRRQVAYLTGLIPVTEELHRLTHPIRLTEVMRVAAPCAGAACRHFDGASCQLVERSIRLLEPVVDRLPACLIRPRCRWWHEQGAAACFRCPQVVTENWNPSEVEARAAGLGIPLMPAERASP